MFLTLTSAKQNNKILRGRYLCLCSYDLPVYLCMCDTIFSFSFKPKLAHQTGTIPLQPRHRSYRTECTLSLFHPLPTSPSKWVKTVLHRKSFQALAGVAQWIEHRPANQGVSSSMPSQGTCLGCRPCLQWQVCVRQPYIDVSLPLFLSPLPSL